MDYEVYQYADREKGHYFLREVTGNKRRAYALAKKPDKYFVFQGNYRLPSDNITKKTMTMKQAEETTKPSIMEQYNELKQGYNNLDDVRRIIRESIKALKGEIPSTLAGYFYGSLGTLEVIKIKNNLNYRLTTDEVNYLIEEASKSQNKQN